MSAKNEHWITLASRKLFDGSVSRRAKHAGPKLYYEIQGKLKDGQDGIWALRYPSRYWTTGQAREHAMQHYGTTDAINPATHSVTFSTVALDAPESKFRHLAQRKGGVEVYDKDILRVGTYVHPRRKWRLAVDRARLDRLIAAFNRMRANGVDVEVTVDHSLSADDVRGYITKLWRDGDVLYARHEFRNAGDLPRRCRNTSVWIERNYRDGHGTSYGDAIVHNSLVQGPVMPGQREFIPVAASRGGDESIPCFAFATTTVERSNTMAEDKTTDLVKTFRELLSLDESIDDDGVAGKVKEYIDELEAEKSKLGEKLTALEGELQGLKQKNTEMSRDSSKQRELDPDVASQLAEGASAMLSRLVDDACITPAVRNALEKEFVGDENGYNSFALSRTISGRKESIVKTLCRILGENDVLELGERSKAATEMEREETTPPDFDESVHKSMLGMAYGPQMDT